MRLFTLYCHAASNFNVTYNKNNIDDCQIIIICIDIIIIITTTIVVVVVFDNKSCLDKSVQIQGYLPRFKGQVLPKMKIHSLSSVFSHMWMENHPKFRSPQTFLELHGKIGIAVTYFFMFFLFFILDGPCQPSSFKLCSGDIIFLWKQLVYSFIEKDTCFLVCIMISLIL